MLLIFTTTIMFLLGDETNFASLLCSDLDFIIVATTTTDRRVGRDTATFLLVLWDRSFSLRHHIADDRDLLCGAGLELLTVARPTQEIDHQAVHTRSESTSALEVQLVGGRLNNLRENQTPDLITISRMMPHSLRVGVVDKRCEIVDCGARSESSPIFVVVRIVDPLRDRVTSRMLYQLSVDTVGALTVGQWPQCYHVFGWIVDQLSGVGHYIEGYGRTKME